MDRAEPAEPSDAPGVVVLTAESPVRRPAALARAMLRDLRASRELAWRLFSRDLTARYRGSALGFAWALVPPLFMTGALSLAARANVVNVGPTPAPYPVYLLVGMVVWQTFADALQGPIAATAGARSILAKVAFPREALVLAKLGDVAVDLAIKAALVAAALAWYRQPVGAPALLALPALGAVVLLGTALGLLLAPLALLSQDVKRGLGFATTVLFWLTPIAYAAAPREGPLAAVVRWNPLTPMVDTPRALLLGAPPAAWPAFLAVSAAGLLLALAGWVVYRLAMPFVIERTGA
jgi:lipopolysaccharide transport system permease protein